MQSCILGDVNLDLSLSNNSIVPWLASRCALSCVAGVFLLMGCSAERERAPGEGAHPVGWADIQNQDAPAFHRHFLRANGEPLARCRECHGSDYSGGAVGVSCRSSGCHTNPEGPEFCGTCHGSDKGARPSTGAHSIHIAYCTTCHNVPTQVSAPGHIDVDAAAIVQFSGIAVLRSPNAVWNKSIGRCTDTYCHGAQSPVWTNLTPIGCDGCHGHPPDDHSPWKRLTSTCIGCHPAPEAGRHINGNVDLLATVNCTSCHGQGNSAAPPPALSGATSASERGVGAHQRHVSSALSDRMGRAVPCQTCHIVPASITAPGHFKPDVLVHLPNGGRFDSTTATCTVDCHYNKIPGPSWTDTSGKPRQCNACHEFPPVTTRNGTPHPSVNGVLAECLACHTYDPATHVNGIVNFLP